MRTVFFTFITPTFNRVDKIHRVFESLCQQTLRSFEWIVIDDGSKDGTKEQIKAYQQEADFEIHYYYKENEGKTSALALGIPMAKGELIIIADSDDCFVAETVEKFSEAWLKLTEDEQEKCNGILALCVTQNGQNIGEDYRNEGYYNPIDFAFGGEIERVGENWIASNATILKKHWVLNDAEKMLGFIPESHFWNKIVMSEKPIAYRINQRLRIFYVNENEPSLSVGIRKKAPKGLHFDAHYFITHYTDLLWKYPKPYLKHLLKYALFTQYLGYGFFVGLQRLPLMVKILYSLAYPFAFLLRNRYFR
ncbi:glycosyltransferase family A protein [Helicobacter monodelphidis]|uniref:glycosyltransferase family A protein n=1 Tax=Helicobacter sp. 15-1451 TaxID=2004995 RepID=UPI0015EB3545|nr:glycosyltransferase family A protein [Helicobacter sp. 15-1451]